MILVFILYICVFGGDAASDLPQGASCVANGLKGTCIPPKQCPTTVLVDIPQKKNLEICSFKGREPIICCTDCDFETRDPLNAVITFDGYRFKTGKSKAFDKCLEYLERLDYQCKLKIKDRLKSIDRANNCTYVDTVGKAVVYNGENAERREFPHMALVGYGPELNSVEWLCGGSVISDRFVLTAGHCAVHNTLGPVTYVAMGMLKRSDPARYWRKYKVKRFVSHPEYKPPLKYHDIALIETEKQIKFSRDVLPICLAETSLSDSEGIVAGWGALGHRRESADILQKAKVEKFSDPECDYLYPKHRHLPTGVNRNSQVCYGDSQDDSDTCGGDSGGPLQVDRSDVSSCVKFLVGVTSYGRECGFQGGAGIYTKVLPYLPWIERIVWP